jgi:hypothetical protein
MKMSRKKVKKQTLKQEKEHAEKDKKLQYEIPKLVKIEGVGVTTGQSCIQGSFFPQ